MPPRPAARLDSEVLFYRLCVLAYAALLPAYAWHRLAVTVAGRYQTFVAVCELLGALNVLLLGAIRFRVPWAEAVPLPPETPLSWDESRSREEEPTRERVFGPFDVHILVPVCNEPDDVVFGTVRAALALQHPLARRLTVWLLDDGAVATREGVLHSMASPGMAQYLSRPKDPTVPRHGKAGNLNHALRTMYPRGKPADDQVIIIFDCDMEAHGDFLAHTLPFLANGPLTALVQTPQHFYNVCHAGDIFNHQNLLFFQAVQPGLDSWGATVCCGTNFAVRANALCEVGWFPTESITEDFLLSLKLAAEGYDVRYHAAVLSTGEAPEDLRQIFKQRLRWCCGCFQVFTHPAAYRLLGRLRPMQALCYLNAPLSYLTTLLTTPLWAVVPALSLAFDVHPVRCVNPLTLGLWLAQYLMLVMVTELLPDRIGRRFAAFLGSKANAISRPHFT